MLAMNYMQVYEDAIANGWSESETEAAYYNSALGGGMTSFVFSNLDIALGYKEEAYRSSADEGEIIDMGDGSFAISRTVPQSDDEL